MDIETYGARNGGSVLGSYVQGGALSRRQEAGGRRVFQQSLVCGSSECDIASDWWDGDEPGPQVEQVD
jgi:hypothetical protein